MAQFLLQMQQRIIEEISGESNFDAVRYHKVYCKLLNLQKITQKQRSKEFV